MLLALFLVQAVMSDCSVISECKVLTTNSQITYIRHSLFVGCQRRDGGDGGAIGIQSGDDPFVTIDDCRFIRCSAVTPSRGWAGAVFLRCNNAQCLRSSGESCWCDGEVSFCFVTRNGFGTCICQETSAVACTAGQKNTIRVCRYDQYNEGTSKVTHVNITLCCAPNHCSTFNLGEREVLNFAFCRMHSNSPANTLLLYISSSLTETYRCLEFANNSVDSTRDNDFKGLISVSLDCTFEDCIFLNNTVDVLVSNNPAAQFRTATFRRCYFDTLPTSLVIFSAVVTFTEPVMDRDALDPGHCSTSTPADSCSRHVLAACGEEVRISDCVFQSLSGDVGGGVRVWGECSQLTLVSSEFLSCAAQRGEGKAGAAFFAGRRACIRSIVAGDCSATGECSCCWIQLQSAVNVEGIDVSDFSCIGGSCQRNTFHLNACDAVGRMNWTFVNVSSSQAQNGGSGVEFASGEGLKMLFCHFSSCVPSSTIIINPAPDVASETYSCLEFTNNTAGSGMISVNFSCSFKDCIFMGNRGDGLIGRFETATGITVHLIRSVFDESSIPAAAPGTDGHLSVIKISCETLRNGATFLWWVTCPRTVLFSATDAIIHSAPPADSELNVSNGIALSQIFESNAIEFTQILESNAIEFTPIFESGSMSASETIGAPDGDSLRGSGSSDVSLALGLAFGLGIPIILVVGGAVYYRWRQLGANLGENEDEHDYTQEYYDSVRREKMDEMSVETQNPIWETKVDPVDAFSGDLDEAI
jgi:hypothetical protein